MREWGKRRKHRKDGATVVPKQEVHVSRKVEPPDTGERSARRGLLSVLPKTALHRVQGRVKKAVERILGK